MREFIFVQHRSISLQPSTPDVMISPRVQLTPYHYIESTIDT